MTNQEYIALHQDDDVRKLALSKAPADVDLAFCLQQIEGRQTAQRKLPEWYANAGLIYPVRVSMEQCSSQQTAMYKRALAERLLPTDRQRMVDLTGGFGIDFSYLARLFDEADYVEKDETLCVIARHNMPLLGLEYARIHQMTGEDFADGMGQYSLVYLDPSRRDAAGRKVVALSDCTPDIEALQEKLLGKAPIVMVKLSPMLDIRGTIRRLPSVAEVHVVSVNGECKEILLVLSRELAPVHIHCVNIGGKTQTFIADDHQATPETAPRPGRFLYEPNASILKAGTQDALCQAYKVGKLHPFSHLFTSDGFIADFPGRSFEVEDTCGFGKKELKALTGSLTQANLTVRNFPATVAELRKRLKLREGGDTYLFATTLSDETHVIIKCKPHSPC